MIFRLLLGIATLAGIVIAVIYYRWQRMPRKKRVIKKSFSICSRISRTSRTALNLSDRKVHLLADIYRGLRIFPYSKEYEDEVNKMFTALDSKSNGKTKNADYLYTQQCHVSLLSIVFALMAVAAMSLAFKRYMPHGFLVILTGPILFKIPLWLLRSEFMDSQLTAMSQWIEFYNMYSAQFLQVETRVLLIDVVDNFLPLANPQLAKILKRFRIDLDNYGEAKALDFLKYRYIDNVKIHKFVSVAKMRAGGDKAAFDLIRSVQAELLAEEELAYTQDLQSRLNKASKAMTRVIILSCALLYAVMIYALK